MNAEKKEWKPIQRKIGGSDVPKLLPGDSKFGSQSPYGGPYEVYERVVLGVDAPWNKFMERGALIEPTLRAHGQSMLKLEIESCQRQHEGHENGKGCDYFECTTHEFARAQVDDLAHWQGMPVCVDYKSQNRFAKGWGAAGSDDVPGSIHIQMCWEMLCADRDLGILVVGFGDDVDGPEAFNISHVLHYEIERDPALESYCVAVAQEFWWTHIVPAVAPPKTAGKKRKS